MNTVPIFCINLERAAERKEIITKQWIDGLGLNIVFWKAHDRRDIENNNYLYHYNKDLTKKIYGRELSAGEIACATSFVSLMKHCIDSKIEKCIIMEDDVIPLVNNQNYIWDLISNMEIEFPECLMALLHKVPSFQYRKKDQIFYKSKKYFSLCNVAPIGNQMFIIKKEGIKIFYENLQTLFYPADMIQKVFFAPKQMLCIANNPVCDHAWFDRHGGTTYIGNDIRNTHRRFIP